MSDTPIFDALTRENDTRYQELVPDVNVLNHKGIAHNHDIDPSCREYRLAPGVIRGACVITLTEMQIALKAKREDTQAVRNREAARNPEGRKGIFSRIPSFIPKHVIRDNPEAGLAGYQE